MLTCLGTSMILVLVATASTTRIAVVGGSGFIGSHVSKALVSCGCSVTSISRGGVQTKVGPANDAQTLAERFPGEEWISKVDWREADAAIEGAAASVMPSDLAGIVCCVGSGDPLKASMDGWTGASWSKSSRASYDENYLANSKAIAAAAAAGATKCAFVGVACDAELGYGGSLPGMFTAKREAAEEAQKAFGDGLTYFGPHLVVKAGDKRIKMLGSGFAKGLMGFNNALGGIRSFGLDYAAKASLTPPVVVDDLAIAIAAVITGKCDVEESVRSAGMTTPSRSSPDDPQGYEIKIKGRHVDGLEAIEAMARKAEAAGISM